MLPSIRSPILAAGLSLSLSACAVGPDFVAPATPTATGYAMVGDATTSKVRLVDAVPPGPPWWTHFHSARLDAAIAQAMADSPTLDEADSTLGQSQAALSAVRGQAYPQLGATAGVSRERANLQAFGFTGFGDVQLENPTFALYSVGGAIRYDLDLFGGRTRRIESAAAQAEAQGWRAHAAYLALSANVAMQVITIATLSAQIEAAEATIADDERTVDLVRRANELGGATATATLSARTQLERDRALLPPLKGELAAARHALALLSGKAPANFTVPEIRLSDLAHDDPVPVRLPSSLVRMRPDIRAAEADLHAATAEIGVATANLYPNIDLSASITQGSLAPANLFAYDATAWDLAAQLTAPIFDGGTLKAQREAAIAAAKAADARYRQTVLRAFTEVADAMQAIATDEQAIEAQARTEAQATESLRLHRLAFEKGGGTLLDVLEAQRIQHEAVSARVRAEGQRLIDIVRLYAASATDARMMPAT